MKALNTRSISQPEIFNIDKFIKGIRNAAWDMTVAHYWAKKAIENREKGDLWLLCTIEGNCYFHCLNI